MHSAFVIHADDNVATLLTECPAGQLLSIRGAGQLSTVLAAEIIRAQHKVAIGDIPTGGAVIKYGMRIGHAIAAIHAGNWVHLHNCASDFDERSNTLDNDTGAPTDSTNAYV